MTTVELGFIIHGPAHPTMARTPSVEVYASQDLIAKVNEYQDKHGLDSFSEAARELWRRGIQAEVKA